MQGHLMAQSDSAKKELDKLRQDTGARLAAAEATAKVCVLTPLNLTLTLTLTLESKPSP
jgi:hypothetical protein